MIHTNATWCFSVYRSRETDDHVLLALVPGIGCYEIAMRLTPEEVAMFRDRPDDFVTLAQDFVAARDWPAFKDRRIPFRPDGPDRIEIDSP